MTKASTDQFSDEEIAQRRDAIVRVMVNMPPQPRAEKQPAKSPRKATPTALGRKPQTSDASA